MHRVCAPSSEPGRRLAPAVLPSRPLRGGPARAGARPQHGFALIEIALALVVIAVVGLGSVSLTLSGMKQSVENEESAEAQEILRRVLEELQAVPLEEVFPRFNDDPLDDPDGAATAPGGRYTIAPGRKSDFLLRYPDTAADSAVAYRKVPLEVRFLFPVNVDGQLSETAAGTHWSDRAWDLDGDGQIATEVVGGNYRVLPVRVEVSWRGSRGTTRTLHHVRLLSRRLQMRGGTE